MSNYDIWGNLRTEDHSNLYDSDIKQIGDIVAALVAKYSHLPATEENLEELYKEATHEAYEAGFIVHLDFTGIPIGQPPVFDVIQKIGRGGASSNEFDHDRKRFEVLDAVNKGEDFRGQKERSD